MKDSIKQRKVGRPKEPYRTKTISFRIRTHWEEDFKLLAEYFKNQAILKDNVRSNAANLEGYKK